MSSNRPGIYKKRILLATLWAFGFVPALLSASSPNLKGGELPDLVPTLRGMKVMTDVVHVEPSKILIPISVSKTIDPSGQHNVLVSGASREITWGGRQKRNALEAQLRAALVAGDYKTLLEMRSKSDTQLSAKRDGELDETWVAITVKDGSVQLRSVRSQIPKLRNLGEAELTADEIRQVMLPLDPPAAVPTPITDVDDFPFLRHIPGLDLLVERSRFSAGPFVAVIDGQNVTIDGPVAERFYYQGAIPVSTYRSLIAYREGLKHAGWEIIRTDTGPFNSTVELLAHYQKDLRDIWTHISVGSDNQKIEVADPGAALDVPTLTRRLATEGHVILYGIHFDGDGKVLSRFRGSADRLAQALQGSAAGSSFSVVAHVEEREGTAAAMKLAASTVRELIARGVTAGRIDGRGVADLPDRRAPQLPAKAYLDIVKR